MFKPSRNAKEPKAVIFSEYQSYESFSKPDGFHYISVLYGYNCTMEACVRLNEKELEGYSEFGDYYIEKLAAKIRLNPPAYQARFVKE